MRSYCAKYSFLPLTNIGILHKRVLIDLRAINFVHVKTSFHVCYVHVLHHTWNLSRLQKRLFKIFLKFFLLSKFLSDIFFTYSNLKLWITSCNLLWQYFYGRTISRLICPMRIPDVFLFTIVNTEGMIFQS